jgi:hypothetical protein
MDNSQIFVIERADGGLAWLMMHEYEEAEDCYAFANLARAKLKAKELAGVELEWEERESGVWSAVVE